MCVLCYISEYHEFVRFYAGSVQGTSPTCVCYRSPQLLLNTLFSQRNNQAETPKYVQVFSNASLAMEITNATLHQQKC